MMPHKIKTPQKSTEKASATPVGKRAPTAPPSSPKKTVNFFMLVVLLIIAGGFYMYQKGYITKYYPLVKSKRTSTNTLESSVNIPSQGPPEEKEMDTITKSAPPEASNENPSEPRALISSPEEHPEIALLQDRFQALEAKVEALSHMIPDVAEKNQAQGSKASLKTFSTLHDLTYKIQQGLPFDEELQAVTTLLSPEDIASLKAFSKIGVPTLPYLIQHFKKIALLLDQEEAFQKATTFFEKGKALLGQLVQVEKIEPPIHPTDSKTATYKALLRQGNVAAVVKDIKALNHTDEAVELWLTHGQAYDTAQTILTKTKKAFLGS